jgi:hypothetical protein
MIGAGEMKQDETVDEVLRLRALNADLIEMVKQAHVMALSAVNICQAAIDNYRRLK